MALNQTELALLSQANASAQQAAVEAGKAAGATAAMHEELSDAWTRINKLEEDVTIVKTVQRDCPARNRQDLSLQTAENANVINRWLLIVTVLSVFVALYAALRS
jgi:hypothetical protein